MLIGGCDVGSTTGKAVVLYGEEIVSHCVAASTTKPQETARMVMEEAIRRAGQSSVDDLEYIVGTGYGRTKIPFADECMSEITCHARGAHWLDPEIRTVVDVGGQDCKAISLNETGRVVEFVMNDRCAAGTGRFFEAMSRALGCTLEDISALANQSETPATISSQCSVFAESEVVTLINEGVELNDIIAGINNSVANRLFGMVRRIGFRKELAVTGGCSKNHGLAKALEAKLDAKVTTLAHDPQIAGAVGAALIASDKLACMSNGKTRVNR